MDRAYILKKERIMTDNSLLQDFITETGEHLGDTERNLLRLEQQPDDAELLNEIFRSIHTIKGSAEYLGHGADSRAVRTSWRACWICFGAANARRTNRLSRF